MDARECDAWFRQVPESQAADLAAVRALILALDPEVVERLAWSRPCYGTARGLFCYLHSTKHHATLGFQRGDLLTDPAGVLEGTGKAMRHVKLRPGAPFDAGVLMALLQQARRG